MVVLCSSALTFNATEHRKHAAINLLSRLTNVIYIRHDRAELHMPELRVGALRPQIIRQVEQALGTPVIATES